MTSCRIKINNNKIPSKGWYLHLKSFESQICIINSKSAVLNPVWIPSLITCINVIESFWDMNIHLQITEILFLVLRQSGLLKSVALKSRLTINCSNMLSILQKILNARKVIMATYLQDTNLNLVLETIPILFNHNLMKNVWWLFRLFLFCRVQGKVKEPWKS